jgi:hypothetical protein
MNYWTELKKNRDNTVWPKSPDSEAYVQVW